jgi:uncharacterized phage-associated protein
MNQLPRRMGYDVRAVANFVLDLADAEGQSVSNLSINKVVFFLHAYFLVQFEKPLVTAKVEAWNYGPVFRELYREFRPFGEQPIAGRASRINPESGVREICQYDFSVEEQEFLEKIARKYVRFSAGTLVSLSHEKDGPWDQVWNHDTRVNASMNISNDIIKGWYKNAARH